MTSPREPTTAERNRIGALLKPALHLVADFLDRYGLIVPELSFSFRGITVTLSAKRVR